MKKQLLFTTLGLAGLAALLFYRKKYSDPQNDLSRGELSRKRNHHITNAFAKAKKEAVIDA